MKVILIKDCDQGKKDDIIEVADGYAKNFLIKKGFAVAFNKVNKHKQEANVKAKEVQAETILANAKKIKDLIENIKLSFKLKVTNLVVHGSITRKQIHNSLIEKGIKIDTHAIENKKIDTLGISNVEVNLHKEVKAKLKVEVSEDGK